MTLIVADVVEDGWVWQGGFCSLITGAEVDGGGA